MGVGEDVGKGGRGGGGEDFRVLGLRDSRHVVCWQGRGGQSERGTSRMVGEKRKSAKKASIGMDVMMRPDSPYDLGCECLG